MTYETYAAYKSSGEQWLKRLPSHWSVEKISHHCQLIGSGTTPSASNPIYYDGNINWVTTSELREKPIGETKNKITDEALNQYSSLKFYPAGSVIIAMYGATIGRLGWLAQPATVNQACCVYANSTKLSQRYIFYWLLAVRNDLISFASGGGQQNLNQEFLRSIKTFVPPMSEQENITSFLDRKTAEIDTLIAKKRRLLDRLAEKRTALITRAVTKGLNPDAPMKDSGIEWLGEVPAHWEVRRLKDAGSLIGGSGFPHAFQEQKGKQIAFYKVGDLGRSDDGVLMPAPNHTISREEAKTLGAEVLPEGTVVWAKIGAALLLNRRRVIDRVSCVDNNMTAYVPDDSRLITAWAYFWTSQLDFSQLVNGGAVPSLSEGYQSTLPLLLPPVDEQVTIIELVKKWVAELNSLEDVTSKTIDRLIEYRSALITNAVTGQIKVA